MPRFLVQPRLTDSEGAPERGTASEHDVDNWMVAVSYAMERAGISPTEMLRMVCDIDTEGVITVSVPGTGRAFVIHQLDDEREEISSSIEAVKGPLDDEVLDAPSPSLSPAFVERELDDADLDRIIDKSRRITQAADFESACSIAVDILLQVVPAESASVLVHLPDARALRFVVARGPRSDALAGVQMPEEQGIAGLVWRSGTSLLVREITAAPHHYRVMDQATGYHTRGILAVPLRTADGVAGVLELLNPFGAIDFDERHQDAATIVAGRLAAKL